MEFQDDFEKVLAWSVGLIAFSWFLLVLVLSYKMIVG